MAGRGVFAAAAAANEDLALAAFQVEHRDLRALFLPSSADSASLLSPADGEKHVIAARQHRRKRKPALSRIRLRQRFRLAAACRYAHQTCCPVGCGKYDGAVVAPARAERRA